MIKDKRKLKIIAAAAVTLCVICIVFYAGTRVGAAASQPGSQGDPLVTLSYLEKRLTDSSGNSGAGSGAAFEKVTLSAGETLVLEDGGELVLTSGNATVYGEGLVSLTGGEFFESGISAVLYTDYLSVSDKSGITVKGKAVAYVKGSYKKK